MNPEALLEILNKIQNQKCETQTLENKSANKGCPKRLYDTLSSFSNQDDGGIIVFGVNEEKGYSEDGVYDAQDLQKQINNQCLEMEPKVHPLLTVAERDGVCFVSAEIPGIDITERPCYYRGKGRVSGSYVRCGDSDEPMTEYEVYSYEAFRKKYQDDIRIVPRATKQTLNADAIEDYLEKLKKGKAHLAKMSDDAICELMSVYRNNEITLSTILLFSLYPQAYFPQLCITAVVVPGNEDGDAGPNGERFLDNKRIEGTIPEMLEQALHFIQKNTRTQTIIDQETGKRKDRTDYPMIAVREALLNALVHRDYSIHTEGIPIQVVLYDNRLEIRNPGEIYGRMKIDQLGKVQPDTRNPVLAVALETLKVAENRYSGIPTIRREIEEYNLAAPEFRNERGSFTVILYKERAAAGEARPKESSPVVLHQAEILAFCKEPRSKKDIAALLNIKTVSYAYKMYILPLIENGLLQRTIPENERSHMQQFYTPTAK